MIDWAPADLAPEDRDLWDAMGDAVPVWSPMPRPGATHELHAVDVVTRALGTPMIPWQRWAVRVMTERSAADPRRFAYPDMTVTVERQSGKTTLIRGVLLARAITNRHRQAFYTAQTGKDATERWTDLVYQIEHSPLRPGVKVRKAIGTQRLVVTSTESRLSPFAPTSESLHGYTPHDVAVDECFSFDEAEGNDLTGAIKPAQQTLVDRQVIWLSTAGHARSTWWRAKVEAGRAANADPSGGVALLEWSLPQHADPYDEGNWTTHPAHGHLITHDDLRELARSVPEGEWRRAFWNQWIDSVDPVYDLRQWDACLDTTIEPPPLGSVVLGYGTDVDRQSASIVAAWALADGRQCVREVWSTAHGETVDRLAMKVCDLRGELHPRAVVADNGGLTRVALDLVRARAEREGWLDEAVSLTPSEWVLASTSIVGKLAERRLAHFGDATSAGIRAAVTRSMGESWALSHSSPASMLATAAALRGLDVVREYAAPVIYLGPDD